MLIELREFGLLSTVSHDELVQTIRSHPGFERVGSAEFRSYHDHHCSRITWIVAPRYSPRRSLLITVS